jgi:hypothetical protein
VGSKWLGAGRWLMSNPQAAYVMADQQQAHRQKAKLLARSSAAHVQAAARPGIQPVLVMLAYRNCPPTCQKHSSRASPQAPSPSSVTTRKWLRSCTPGPGLPLPAAWPQPLAAHATACRSAAVMHHLWWAGRGGVGWVGRADWRTAATATVGPPSS